MEQCLITCQWEAGLPWWRGTAWQEAVRVRQQEREHSLLGMTWPSPQPSLCVVRGTRLTPGLLAVFLSTVWLYTCVKPGILLADLESDKI